MQHDILRQVVLYHLFQLQTVDRLGKVIGKTCGNIRLARAADGVCGKRDAGRMLVHAHAVRTERGDGLKAVHVRHEVVDKNDVVALFARGIKPLHAVAGRVYLHARVAEQAPEHRQVYRRVIDHQNLRRRRLEALLVAGGSRIPPRLVHAPVTHRLPVLDALLHRKGKDAPLAVLALHLKGSAHRGEQALDDAHAKPGSLDAAVAALLHAGKRGTEPLYVLRFDADARVADFRPHADSGIVLLLKADIHGDAAFPRILDGIRQQVQQTLLDARVVPVQAEWHGLVHVHAEYKAFRVGARLYHVHKVGDERAEIVVYRKNLHLARLNL